MEKTVIDWELSTQLAGNNLDNAKEFLVLLTKDLISELTEIKRAHQLKNYDEVKLRVHKLHGALSYSGVPRLKSATRNLENALKENSDILLQLEQFEFEINQVLQQMDSLESN